MWFQAAELPASAVGAPKAGVFRALRGSGLSRAARAPPLEAPAWPRRYRIQSVINWPRIRKNAAGHSGFFALGEVLEVETKQRTTKNRSHAEALDVVK